MCQYWDFERILDFCVNQPTVYSDHCILEFRVESPVTTVVKLHTKSVKKYFWKTERKVEFVSVLDSDNVSEQFVNMLLL